MRALIIIPIITLFWGCKSHTVTKTNNLSIDTQTAMQWYMVDDMSTIIELAKKEDKLIFLDFYTDWCLPCQMMDQDVFTDQQIGDYFALHYISYKVNAEKGNGPFLATQYLVGKYPSLLFLNSDGREIMRRERALYHTDLMSVGRKAVFYQDSINNIH